MIGAAGRTKQVMTITVGSATVGHTFTITINSKSVTYTAVTGDTTTDIATALVALCVASSDPEFYTMLSWKSSAAVITVTAITAGEPFTISLSGTGTLTLATTTANSSPEDIANPLNWSGSTLPVNGDTVIFQFTPESARWNLESALSAVALANLSVLDYPARIGNDLILPSGIREYRGTELTLAGCTILDLNLTDNTPGRFRFNVGSAACALNITGPGNVTPGNVGVVVWRGTHASNIVKVTGCSLDVATDISHTASIDALSVENGAIRLGAGVTKSSTTAVLLNSTLITFSNFANLTLDRGSTAIYQEATTGTLITLRGESTLIWASSGNVTSLVIGPNCTVDFSQAIGPITITNVEFRAANGARWRDPNGRVTVTNGMKFNQCGPRDLAELDVGRHLTFTTSAY